MIPEDLVRLPSIIEAEFGRAVIDDIATAIAREWKGQIVEVRAVDSSTYLDAVEPGEPVDTPGGLTVTVEAPEARGYSDVVERGWRTRGRGQESYRGRYPAKRGVEAAEGDIRDALDRAADRVRG